MFFIAVDPGETTGYCTYNTHNRQLNVYSCPNPGAYAKIKQLIQKHHENCIMILERSPFKQNEIEQMIRVKEYIGLMESEKKVGDDLLPVVIFSPGDWKPVAKARKWKHPHAGDNHQNDAYCLLVYYVWKTQKEDFHLWFIEGEKS